MADTTTLALEDLYDQCVARFASEGTFGATPDPTTAAQQANPFGWRESARQLKPFNRIVWQPGDERGSAGPLGPPRYPGRLNPGRPLGTLREFFTVFITGYDPSAKENERAQWKATRLLYDAWYRAVYLAAHGTYEITGQHWDVTRNERRLGATLIVTAAIQAMIPDTKPTLAPANVAADIVLTELDVSEEFRAPA